MGLSQGKEKEKDMGQGRRRDVEKVPFVYYKLHCHLSIPHLCPLFV